MKSGVTHSVLYVVRQVCRGRGLGSLVHQYLTLLGYTRARDDGALALSSGHEDRKGLGIVQFTGYPPGIAVF